MSTPLELHAERNALETQLLKLEQAIEERHQSGMVAADLADHVVSLLAQLEQINAKLAELRSPAAPT